jgi:DNA-binding MarR family transcriptional regulator
MANETGSVSPLQAVAPPKRYEAWRFFLRAYKNVLSQIEADLEAASMGSAAQYEVMARIHMAPERRVRFVELSKSLFLSQSRITRLIQRLEAEGLVRCEKSVADGHWAMFASLTEDGRRLYESAVPILIAGFERYFSQRLREEDLDALIRSFHALAEE